MILPGVACEHCGGDGCGWCDGGGKALLRRCPMSYLRDQDFAAWRMYRLFKEGGAMPLAGGTIDQPRSVLETFEHLAAAEAEVRADLKLD